MTTTRFAVGQIVQRWHDAGCMGFWPVFGEVVRVNRKTVTVRWEHDDTWRIEPHLISAVSQSLVEQIKQEYLNWEKAGGKHGSCI